MAQTLKDAVRRRILCAAEEALYTQGPDVTMRQIARAAGVTPGNLYRYYAGKEELLDAVTGPVLNGLDELIRRHTGQQLALGQTGVQFPWPRGPEGLDRMRQEMYSRLVPVLQDLSALAGQYPRPMAILCQKNEANRALMNWFYGLAQSVLEQLIRPAPEMHHLMELMVRTEGHAFCQGVIALIQETGGLPPPEQRALIQAFLAIHIEGIMWVIRSSAEDGHIQYKGVEEE